MCLQATGVTDKRKSGIKLSSYVFRMLIKIRNRLGHLPDKWTPVLEIPRASTKLSLNTSLDFAVNAELASCAVQILTVGYIDMSAASINASTVAVGNGCRSKYISVIKRK